MANSQMRLFHTSGMEGISAILRQIPEDLRTRITAAAVDAAGKPMVVSMKRFAKRSERTGALREAIGSLVRKYPRNATAVAIVGVRKGHYKKRKLIGSKDDRTGSESPSKYAHLVEFGHNIVTGGSAQDKYSMKLVGTGRYSSKGKELKRWKRDQVVSPAKGRVVGWVPPKPFLRPGFLASKAAVASELRKGLERGIKSTVRRLVKTGAHKR